MKFILLLIITIGLYNPLYAGLITAQGSVTALNNINQINDQIGLITFDEPGSVSGSQIVQDFYTESHGLTYHDGALSSILPGVTTPGNASPSRIVSSSSLNGPILGGASASGNAARPGAAVFAENLDVTQIGLTAGTNGTQYLVAWDRSGNLIGQVTWDPQGTRSFVGLDTNGVSIGMAIYGNDDLFAGETYSTGGSSIFMDNFVFGGSVNETSNSVPEPNSVILFMFGLVFCASNKFWTK